MEENNEKKSFFKTLFSNRAFIYSLMGTGIALIVAGVIMAIVFKASSSTSVSGEEKEGEKTVAENTPTPSSVPTEVPTEAVTQTEKDPRDQVVATVIPIEDLPKEIEKPYSKYRSELYVKTYLLFGIEEIDGAANTDAILLLSINTKDNTLKLTSIMRDTFVEIPGFYGNKINSVYAHGLKVGDTIEEKRRNGANLLMEVIGQTFDIDISGYMFVNFKSFEKIVDRLGGIDIQLGSREASYLNYTNYISNPSYRNVHSGWNHLNGNQVVGYSRLRKVPNINGTNNDYGRTERHRMVIDAIIQQYKSLSLLDMYSVLADCLAYVQTDLTEDQIAEMIENVVENKIFTMNQMRIPIDGMFSDSGKKGKFNGKYNVTYSLLIDKYLDETVKKFHEFVFLDDPNAAKEESGSGEEVPDDGMPTGDPNDE